MLELENVASPQQVELNFYSAKSRLHRLLWHAHALGSVFGVLFLLMSSLVWLNLHWLSKKLPNVGNRKFKRNFSGSAASPSE
jgi:hypothetical protein